MLNKKLKKLKVVVSMIVLSLFLTCNTVSACFTLNKKGYIAYFMSPPRRVGSYRLCPCVNGIPPATRGDQAPLLERLVDCMSGTVSLNEGGLRKAGE